MPPKDYNYYEPKMYYIKDSSYPNGYTMIGEAADVEVSTQVEDNIDVLKQRVREIEKSMKETMEVSMYFKNCFGITDGNKIEDIEVIVENKVVLVTFADGHKEKMVLQDPDEFSMEKALYIAIAKKLYRSQFTFEGIEKMAEEMRYLKCFEKIVKDGLKLYKEIQKEQAREEEVQEIIKRKRNKKVKYKKRREERKREDAIKTQEEAFYRAMKRINSETMFDDGK